MMLQIEDLPTGVMAHIFSFFTLAEVKPLTLVCQDWRNIIHKWIFLRKLLLNVPSAHRITKEPIETGAVLKFYEDFPISVNHLKIDVKYNDDNTIKPEYVEYFKKCGRNLKSCIINVDVILHPMLQLLRYLPKLEYLEVNSASIYDYIGTYLPENSCKMSNLKRVKFTNPNLALLQGLYIFTSELESISVIITRPEEQVTLFLFQHIFRKNCYTLKEIEIQNKFYGAFRRMYLSMYLHYLMNNLELPNLKKVYVNNPNEFIVESFYHLTTKLESLNILNMSMNAASYPYKSMIKKNRRTLREITISEKDDEYLKFINNVYDLNLTKLNVEQMSATFSEETILTTLHRQPNLKQLRLPKDRIFSKKVMRRICEESLKLELIEICTECMPHNNNLCNLLNLEKLIISVNHVMRWDASVTMLNIKSLQVTLDRGTSAGDCVNLCHTLTCLPNLVRFEVVFVSSVSRADKCQIIEVLSKFCPDIEYLRIENKSTERCMDFRRSCQKSFWFDFPELIELHLKNLDQISFDDVNYLTQKSQFIEKLSINDCILNDECIEAIMVNLKELKELTLINIKGLTNLSLLHIAENDTLLKALTITNCMGLKPREGYRKLHISKVK